MIYEKEFTLAGVADAVGGNPSTMRTHISRGYVVAEGPRSPVKPSGKHGRFTFFTVMEFAMAYEIASLGVNMETAFKAGASFAHAGGGGTPYDLPVRAPAVPFHQSHGVTIFGFAGPISFEVPYRPDKRGERPPTDTYLSLQSYLGTKSFITINASEVFNEVCHRIGQQPCDLLDQIYATDGSKGDARRDAN